MSPETRRAALSATARIAFATVLAGCHTTPPAGSGTSSSSDARTATSAAAPVKVSAGACDTTARGGPALAAAASCCKALVGAAVDGGAGLAGTAQHACCAFLAEQNDARYTDGGRGPWDMPYRDECCSALGWPQTVTCTPWGPPVPPEYDVVTEFPAEVAA